VLLRLHDGGPGEQQRQDGERGGNGEATRGVHNLLGLRSGVSVRGNQT
jgi:hypothetical protein